MSIGRCAAHRLREATGLWLNALDGRDNQHHAIEHAQ